MYKSEVCVICNDKKPEQIGFNVGGDFACKHCCVCTTCSVQLLECENVVAQCPLCKRQINSYKKITELRNWDLIQLTFEDNKEVNVELCIIRSMIANTLLSFYHVYIGLFNLFMAYFREELVGWGVVIVRIYLSIQSLDLGKGFKGVVCDDIEVGMSEKMNSIKDQVLNEYCQKYNLRLG